MKLFNFLKREISVNKRRLKRKFAGTVSIGGIGSGTALLSPNITGNVMSNLNQTSSNWVGGILFAAGIIAGFVWWRNRK